jgi:hypothetical protein
MKRTLRTAELANNLQDGDTSRGFKLQIKLLDITLPLHLSQTDGQGTNESIKNTAEDVVYNLAIEKLFTPKKSPDKVLNALVDTEYKNETGNDRFVYVGSVDSIITRQSRIVYYDRKYKDMFIIPDPAGVAPVEKSEDGTSSVVAPTKTEFVVIGKLLVGGGYGYESITNLPYVPAQDDRNYITLPEPNDISGLASHIFVLDGSIFELANINNSGYTTQNGRYIEGPFGRFIELISLGGTETLFGQDVKIQSYMLSHIKDQNYSVRELGLTPLDDILMFG